MPITQPSERLVPSWIWQKPIATYRGTQIRYGRKSTAPGRLRQMRETIVNPRP
jgi:hypothetical protein